VQLHGSPCVYDMRKAHYFKAAITNQCSGRTFSYLVLQNRGDKSYYPYTDIHWGVGDNKLFIDTLMVDSPIKAVILARKLRQFYWRRLNEYQRPFTVTIHNTYIL